MPAVNIPPDVRVVLDDYIDERVREKFGGTPPSADEEARYIEEWLERGVTSVPLRDGSVVTVAGGADFGSMEDQMAGGSGHKPDDFNWKAFATKASLVIIAAIVIGYFMLRDTDAKKRREAEETPTSETALSSQLPSGIDALVTSGEVRVPLVVPRTLEISVSDRITTSTFIVVPVEVAEADWPCPEAEKGEPVACWVFGTLVNYLVGIPYSEVTESLLRDLGNKGGIARMRMSSGDVMEFEVTEVRSVGRQQIEVLNQDRFAITIPLLGGPAGSSARFVAFADYVAASGGGVSQPSEGDQEVTTIHLGEEVVLDAISLTPVSSSKGNQSELTLSVKNHAELPLSAGAGWDVVALREDGSTVEAEIDGASVGAHESSLITLSAQGNVSSWRIKTGHSVINVIH